VEIQKILLVDDSPEIQQIGRLCLTQIGGWEVCVASSGEAALEIAIAEAPDLVLLDVMMPRLDGPATLRALRERGVTAPVIFLTARAAPQEQERLLESGAIGVISKPFRPKSLPDEIRRLADAGPSAT